MMDINSVIYGIIFSKSTMYIYPKKICNDFNKLEIAKYFSPEQIAKLVSLYLEKLTKKGALTMLNYHKGVRYRKTDLFYKPPQIIKIEKEMHFSFLSALNIQKAICDLELLQCRTSLIPYDQSIVSGRTLEREMQIDYLIKKERVYFLQNKASAINNLLGLYKLNSYSLSQNN